MGTNPTLGKISGVEAVSFLLDQARRVDDMARYFTKLACDVATGRVSWSADERRAVEKEMGEIAGKLLRQRDMIPASTDGSTSF